MNLTYSAAFVQCHIRSVNNLYCSLPHTNKLGNQSYSLCLMENNQVIQRILWKLKSVGYRGAFKEPATM